MNIAIIGAGNVGTALATSMTNAGHQVVISAADPEHARAAAREERRKGRRRTTPRLRATRTSIVLAVPFVAAGEAVAADIAPVVAGKVVIDATNPLATDYHSLATGDISGAETFQQQLPEAKVVKAFNSLFASRLAQPDRSMDAFIAADDEDATATASFARPVARLPPGLRRPSELRALPRRAWPSSTSPSTPPTAGAGSRPGSSSSSQARRRSPSAWWSSHRRVLAVLAYLRDGSMTWLGPTSRRAAAPGRR